MRFVSIHYKKLLLAVLLLSLAVLSITRLFDNYGVKYTDEGFQRSLVAFAIAKGLNGAISIVQGTEIALEPAGIGVILTPGQILDPANDLIERFSWVMLLCTTSLGIQSVLLTISSSLYYSVAVSVFLLLAVLMVWRSTRLTGAWKNTFYRIVAFLVILRFFIPVMAVASDGLYRNFLEPKYLESTQHLEDSDRTITRLSKDSMEISKVDRNLSWYQSLSKNINSAIDAFDVERRVEELKTEVATMTTHIIDLIIVFIIQTVLFPLMFLWLTMRLVKLNFVFNYVRQ